MGMMTPEQEEHEARLVFDSMPRRYRRRAKKGKKPAVQLPDITKGMSNHQRMLLKKIGRGGDETRSRTRRNSKSTKKEV